jgi:hypothetical protein
MKGALREEHDTFVIISHSDLLGMETFSDKSCRESRNPYFFFNTLFSKNHVFYENAWKNIVERGRPHMTTWYMCIACWILFFSVALRTNAGHVLLILKVSRSHTMTYHSR